MENGGGSQRRGDAPCLSQHGALQGTVRWRLQGTGAISAQPAGGAPGQRPVYEVMPSSPSYTGLPFHGHGLRCSCCGVTWLDLAWRLSTGLTCPFSVRPSPAGCHQRLRGEAHCSLQHSKEPGAEGKALGRGGVSGLGRGSGGRGSASALPSSSVMSPLCWLGGWGYVGIVSSSLFPGLSHVP